MKKLKILQTRKLHFKNFRKSNMLYYITFIVFIMLFSCVSKTNNKEYIEDTSNIAERDNHFNQNKISGLEFSNLYAPNPSSPYVIEVVKDRSYSGALDIFLRKDTFNHMITIGFNCGTDDSFISLTAVSFKNIMWRINDKLNGNATTDSNGYFKVFFNDTQVQAYEKVFIQYKKREYNVSLPAYKKVIIDTGDCLLYIRGQ